jgi:[ribosomal protein S5]-alanine N-acetyltransferase
MSQFRPPELIESNELLLRPPEPRDAQALFDEMLGDADTTRHLGFRRHATPDETLSFIEDAQRGWQDGTLIRWVLEDKASGRLTALIELRPQPPRAELGVVISRRGGARRRRAGLYALRRLLKWLLAQPPIFRIYAYCAVDGDAHSSMERLGFTLEAKLTNHECRPNLGLLAADSYLYAMTRPLVPPGATPATAWLAEHVDWEPA